jgi:VCBS repeat-containing protein
VLDSNVATVSLTVAKVEIAPTLVSSSATVNEDASLVFSPLANATDVNRDPLTSTVVTQPAHGTIAVNPNGTWSYTPNQYFYGTDSFTYKVSDGVLDSNVATVSLTVAKVEIAPTLVNSSASLNENTNVVFSPLANATDVNHDALTAAVVAQPAHGAITVNRDGSWTYTPNQYFYGTDSFTYKVSDGVLDSNVATVSLTVMHVNQAPVAIDSQVTGTEDTPYVLRWSDFAVTDVDNDALTVAISALPADGSLQKLSSGGTWTSVVVGDHFAQADIGAGKLRFVPAANASGGSGYAASGYGNMHAHYARFSYTVSDGQLSSNVATVSIDITAVADAPVLQLLGSAVTHQLFDTGWEAAANVDNQSTLVAGTAFNGWSLVTAGDQLSGGQNGFEVWSSGDQMADAYGRLHTVAAETGDGNNWLELNDASGAQYQTLGISRQVTTDKGASYNLSFDLAGRLGYNSDTTRIGVYVDGVRVAMYDNTSGTTALNWQHANISFVGSGGKQTIQIVTEADQRYGGGRGMMLDNVALDETMQLNHGVEGGTLELQGIQAALTDTDGSESLRLTVAGLPVGSVLSDGVHSTTITAAQPVADVTGWNTYALAMTPPANYSGKLSLQVTATSTEVANGSKASVSQVMNVQVDAVAQTPVLTLTPPTGKLSREIIDTDWDEGYKDRDSGPDLVKEDELEDWTLQPASYGKVAAFPVWEDGDQMTNALGKKVSVVGPAGVDTDDAWLGLTNGVGSSYQASGISQSIATVDGGTYTFNLNYAGALGQAAANTKIGVYLDGQLIGSYANTSSNTALNWQALSFTFKGDGRAHSLGVRLMGGSSTVAAGAMLEGVKLIETLPDSASIVYGMEGSAIALPGIVAQLANGDPGNLALQLLGLPRWATLTDGTHTVTSTSCNAAVDLTGWNLVKLSVTLPYDWGWYDDEAPVVLQVKATATDASSNTSASIVRSFTVQQLDGCACATPSGVNPYVSYTNNTAVTTKSVTTTALAVSPLVAAVGGHDFGVTAAQVAASMHADATDSDKSMEEWMQGLSQSLSNAFLKEMDLALRN